MTGTRVVIVGGGLAAAKAAEALRASGFDGTVTIVGEETHRPYERPPLSKGYLLGTADRASVFVHPGEWYAEHHVDLRLGLPAVSVDPGAHVVRLADGDVIPYDRLLLATGSSPRLLDVPGADLNGVHYLRRLEDCDQLRDTFAASARVVIVGAGWIGLETAAAARAAGVDVTVL